MAKYTTYILSENSKMQAEFYTKVLGGEILSVMTYGQLPDANEAHKDKVIHLSLVACGVNFFMSDAFEPVQKGNNIRLSLEFATEDEAREAFAKLAEEGTIHHPLEPAFWGALHGQIEDKFGVVWMITNKAPQQA